MASSDPLISPVTDKASVLDIVSYGYRAAIRHIWPLTLIALPAILLSSYQGFHSASDFEAGVAAGQASRLGHTSIPTMYIGWIAYLIPLYFNYCATLYSRDVYFNQVDRPIYSYIFGEKKTLSTISIFSGICLLALIPTGLIGIIGLILLIIPGIIWFTYILMVYNMAIVLILQKSTMGVKWSIQEILRLLKNHTGRTIGLGLLVWLIGTIVAVPITLPGILISMGPQMSGNLIMSILSACSYGLGTWLSMSIGIGGVVFTTYRYIADLKIRHGDEDADSMLPAPIEQKA
jgi:hypothetical protein